MVILYFDVRSYVGSLYRCSREPLEFLHAGAQQGFFFQLFKIFSHRPSKACANGRRSFPRMSVYMAGHWLEPAQIMSLVGLVANRLQHPTEHDSQPDVPGPSWSPWDVTGVSGLARLLSRWDSPGSDVSAPEPESSVLGPLLGQPAAPASVTDLARAVFVQVPDPDPGSLSASGALAEAKALVAQPPDEPPAHQVLDATPERLSTPVKPRRPAASLSELALVHTPNVHGALAVDVENCSDRTPDRVASERTERRHREKARGRKLSFQEAGERSQLVQRVTKRAMVCSTPEKSAKPAESRMVSVGGGKPTSRYTPAQFVNDAVHGVITAAGGTCGKADQRCYLRCAKAIVAGAMLEQQRRAVRLVGQDDQAPWIVFSWAWDSTPEKCRRTAVVSGTKAKRLRITSSEHMVQLGTLTRIGVDGVLQHDEVLAPPLVIADTTAGSILASLQKAWDTCGTHPLELSTRCGVMVLCLVIDSFSANLTVLRWLRQAMPSNVVVFTNLCALHQVMRIISDFQDMLLSNVYSLSKLMIIDTYFDKFLVRLADTTRRSFRYVHGVAPDAECVARAQLIVEHCSGAPIDDVVGPRAERLRACLAMLNGDWHSEIVTHFCVEGCPCGANGLGDEAASRETIVEAMLDLLVSTRPPRPAVNRWGKQLPCMGWWLMGILCHRLFPRGVDPSFASVNVEDEATAEFGQLCACFGFGDIDQVADLASFKEELRRRKAGAKEFLDNPDQNRLLATAVILLGPMSHLVAGLMADTGDRAKNAQRLQQEPGAPEFVAHIRRCNRVAGELAEVAFTELPGGVWQLLPHRPSDELGEAAGLSLRGAVLTAAAGLFLRFDCLHVDPVRPPMAFPFRLLAIPHMSEEEQQQLAEEFFRYSECELDYFALSIKRLAETPAGLLTTRIKHLLEKSGTFLCLHTQVLEAKHGRRRQYRECRSQVRGLSHTVSHYLIRESCRLHLATRQKIRSLRSRRVGKCKKRRSRMMYVNRAARRHALAHGRTPLAQAKALRRAWGEEFDAFSPEEKDIFAEASAEGNAILPSLSGPHQLGGEVVATAVDPRAAAGHFKYGNTEYPINPDFVQEFCSDLGFGGLFSEAGGQGQLQERRHLGIAGFREPDSETCSLLMSVMCFVMLCYLVSLLGRPTRMRSYLNGMAVIAAIF